MARLTPFQGGILTLVERRTTHVELEKSVHADPTTVQDYSAVQGAVRELGVSRKVFIESSSPNPRRLRLMLDHPKKEDVAQIIKWSGRPVYYRDGSGRSMWGVYNMLDAADDYLLGHRIASLPLEITEISESRSVS